MMGFAPSGFDPHETLANAANSIPAWQRDVSKEGNAVHGALLERRAVLNAFNVVGRKCVIFDKQGQVILGNAGWSKHILELPVLSTRRNVLAPSSAQSQQELNGALELLFGDHTIKSVPVALRDLDGWVSDVIHIKRVGPANPSFAFAMLPKTGADIAASVASLSGILGLTPFEVELVGYVVKGSSDSEMCNGLNQNQSEIKQGLRQLITKFRVRQKSDIVRLLASFS